MTDVQEIADSEITSRYVVKGMQERKASEIVVVDLRKVPQAVADFFVICSGTSDTQIDAIADAVEEEVFKEAKVNPWRKEGKERKEWILIDYADVVVHIFQKEKREFYGLEKLWGDAMITQISEL